MIRVFLVVKVVFVEIARLVHPHAVIRVRIGGAVVPRDVVTNVLGFFILYMLVFVGGVLFMAAIGMDMPTSFGATAATLCNVGPGLGLVGPTEHYGLIPMAGKWVLSFLMLMGRLELFTVIILLSPHFWQK